MKSTFAKRSHVETPPATQPDMNGAEINGAEMQGRAQIAPPGLRKRTPLGLTALPARPKRSPAMTRHTEGALDEGVLGELLTSGQVQRYNHQKFGSYWREWASAATAGDGNRTGALSVLMKWPGTADVRTLHLDALALTSLPKHLPNFMTGLSLNNNILIRLPDLPVGPRALSVNDNLLTELPATLPDSIRRLHVYGNLQLTSLPAKLPDGLNKRAVDDLKVAIESHRERSLGGPQD